MSGTNNPFIMTKWKHSLLKYVKSLCKISLSFPIMPSINPSCEKFEFRKSERQLPMAKSSKIIHKTNMAQAA